MNLRKSHIAMLLAAVLLTACGCKSSRKAAATVNVKPQFDGEVVWVLQTIRGNAPNYGEGQKEITIQFNPESGMVNGTSGCNRFFGSFKDHGSGRMELSDIGSSKMACPDAFMKLERNFLQTLKKCDGYDLGEYQLDLKQGGNTVLSFYPRPE